LRCTVGSETRDLRAGDFMSTPRGEVHAFSNPHARRGAGARDQQTGREVGSIIKAGGPPDRAKLLATIRASGWCQRRHQERHSTDDCWRMHLHRFPQHAGDRRFAVASLKAEPMPATSPLAQPSYRSSTSKFDRPLSKISRGVSGSKSPVHPTVTNDRFQS